MRVKDGGAMMGVDQATDHGAELSRLIMELVFLILQQIRDANGDSETRAELLSELVDIKNQLDMIYHINKLTEDLEHEERVLSPAEKVGEINDLTTKIRKPRINHKLTNHEQFDFN